MIIGPLYRTIGGMKTVMVAKSKFKPKVFEYLRKVESGAEEVCITDHGEPKAKLIAITAAQDEELAALRGLVLKYDRPTDPVEVGWEVQP